MIYQPKEHDQILQILGLYRQTYRDVYGEEPNKEEIIKRFQVLIDERKDKDFRSRFETMGPIDLLAALNSMSSKKPEQPKIDPTDEQFSLIADETRHEKVFENRAIKNIKANKTK